MGFGDLTTIDVTGWPRSDDEQRGKRTKAWITSPDGSAWLRKSVLKKPYRPYEHLIEAFVLELARQSGVESAFARPCTWIEGGATCDGLLVRYFISDNDVLQSGAEWLRPAILPALIRGVSEEVAYSLDVVLTFLPHLDHAAPGTASAFLRMLAFDAWVGNCDRHSENWSLLGGPFRKLRLAPMYDPAACLGSELRDAQVNPLISDEIQFQAYIVRCPSGFGDGVSKGLRMSQVVERLLVEPVWRSNIENWLNDFERAFGSLKQALDQGVPWLPESRQQLALRLLEARLVWLRESTRSG